MSSAPSPPPMPPPLNYATPTPRNDLRDIAIRQKAIMYCILGYVLAIILQFVLPPQLRLFIPAPLAIAAGIAGAVFVFMLALALYGTAQGVVLGILTLVPILGLIILLIINSKASALLQSYGIKVGLLGADLRQIPTAGPPIPPQR